MTALLFEAAARSAILWIALRLAIMALRVRDAHVEKLVWTVVIVLSLTMPALMQVAPLPWSAPMSIGIRGNAGLPALPEGSSRFALATVLVSTYAVVAGILLLRFFVNLLRAFRLYRRARQPATDLFQGIDVRLSHEVRAPCTFGASILLPDGFESWSPTARAAALAHERSHVLNRDCYRLWLATAYSCIFWFNPTAWLVRRRLQLLAELTSDREALRCVGNPTAYAEMLLRLAGGTSSLRAAIAMSGATQLAARITCILENSMINNRLSIGRKVTLSGMSLVAAVLCISCANGPHVLTPSEDPKVSWVSGAPLSDFYPATLRDKRVEGYVVMKLAIDPTGRVTDANVVRENPADAGLGSAATNAARTFQFNNSLARPVIKTLQVRFALKD
jgi:TonB family protein